MGSGTIFPGFLILALPPPSMKAWVGSSVALSVKRNVSNIYFIGFKGASQVVLVVKPCNIRDAGSIPGLRRSPGEGQPTPVFLTGETHGQSNLVGYSPWFTVGHN